MEVSTHPHAPVELAATLVNALTPGERRGVPHQPPTGVALRTAVAELLGDRPNRARAWATADEVEHDRLALLVTEWRAVFAAATAAAGADAAARLVNGLLADAPVAPVLVDHDGEPWHLHAHGDDASPAAGLAAVCALGFATLLADGGGDRLGICAASACDRVYVDLSRNGSRRYCSTACQGRVKTAAFRARRA